MAGSALLIVLVVLTPLFFTSTLYTVYALPKVVVVFACALGMLAFTRTHRISAGLPPWFGWTLLAFLGLVGFSTVTSELPIVSLLGKHGRYEGFLTFVAYAAIALCSRVVLADEPTRRRLHVAVATTLALVSAYAILQRYGIDPFGLSTQAVSRPWSSLGNASTLGAFLALTIPVALTLVLSTKRDCAGLVAASLVASGLGVLALWLSGSRGAWVGLAAGLVLLFFLVPAGSLRRLGIWLGVLVLVTLPFAASGVATRLDPADPWASRTTSGRLALWEHTATLAAEHPVLGWGPATFEYVFPRAVDAEWAERYAGGTIPDDAHNIVLRTAYESGVVAATLLLALGSAVGLAGVQAARAGLREDDAYGRTDWLGVGALSGLAGYSVALLFTPSIPHVSAVAAALGGAALLMAWPFPAASGTRSGKASEDDSRVRRFAVAGTGLHIALALVLAWGLGAHARTCIADRKLRDAVIANSQGRLAEAIALGAQAQRFAPHEVVYGRYTTAVALEGARVHDSGEALLASRRAASRAIERNPIDAATWRLLANALDAQAASVQSDAVAAAAARARADALDPYDIIGTGIR